MTDQEQLQKQEAIRQLQMAKMQNEQARQRKYENQRHMNKPYDVAILLAAINGIKKSNDYILNLKDFKYQIDAINNQLGALKNKGVTSIDGMLFLKARKPKTKQNEQSVWGVKNEKERQERYAKLIFVKNTCIREFLSNILHTVSEVEQTKQWFNRIQQENWEDSHGLIGDASDIAHALWQVDKSKVTPKNLGVIKSFQNNPNCPEVTPRIRINRNNLQLQTATAGSNFSNTTGVGAWVGSLSAVEEAPIKYDIHEDFVDYVFAEAEKEQQRRQVPTPQISANNEAKSEKIIAEKEALEKKLIEQSVTPPSKINPNYVYAVLGVVALLGLVWMFKSKPTTKVIN